MKVSLNNSRTLNFLKDYCQWTILYSRKSMNHHQEIKHWEVYCCWIKVSTVMFFCENVSQQGRGNVGKTLGRWEDVLIPLQKIKSMEVTNSGKICALPFYFMICPPPGLCSLCCASWSFHMPMEHFLIPHHIFMTNLCNNNEAALWLSFSVHLCEAVWMALPFMLNELIYFFTFSCLVDCLSC